MSANLWSKQSQLSWNIKCLRGESEKQTRQRREFAPLSASQGVKSRFGFSVVQASLTAPQGPWCSFPRQIDPLFHLAVISFICEQLASKLNFLSNVKGPRLVENWVISRGNQHPGCFSSRASLARSGSTRRRLQVATPARPNSLCSNRVGDVIRQRSRRDGSRSPFQIVLDRRRVTPPITRALTPSDNPDADRRRSSLNS
jgi:hypothetical protein